MTEKLPTIPTRTVEQGGQYGSEHVDFLYFGRAFFEDSFVKKGTTRLTPEQWNEVDASWPVLRLKVFALARKRQGQRKDCHRAPAAWWRLEAPCPRDLDLTEEEQLASIGLTASKVNSGLVPPAPLRPPCERRIEAGCFRVDDGEFEAIEPPGEFLVDDLISPIT